jgi:Tfp pilus assembly protein PilX
MSMNNQRGFSHIFLLTALVVVSAIGFTGLRVWHSNNNQRSTSEAQNKQLASELTKGVNDGNIQVAAHGKLSVTPVYIQDAIYFHNKASHPLCIARGITDSNYTGVKFIVSLSGKMVDPNVYASPTTDGYIVFQEDNCTSATQLYGGKPSVNSPEFGIVEESETHFKCTNLKMYKVPSSALRDSFCIDATGNTIPYNY